MPAPTFSIPARITASAASRPAPPQPSDRAASAASRVTSAARSCASAVSSPFFPSAAEGASSPAPPGTARHGRARVADRLVRLRDLPDQIPEAPVRVDLPPRLVQFGSRPQVPGPCPAVHPAAQVVLRAVARVPRSRAGAVRLPALTAHLVQRPGPEVPDLAQFPVQLGPPPFQFRQDFGTDEVTAAWPPATGERSQQYGLLAPRRPAGRWPV
jgi:hypothetical protein